MNCLAESKRRITKTKLKIFQRQKYFISKNKACCDLRHCDKDETSAKEVKRITKAGLTSVPSNTGLNKIITKRKIII